MQRLVDESFLPLDPQSEPSALGEHGRVFVISFIRCLVDEDLKKTKTNRHFFIEKKEKCQLLLLAKISVLHLFACPAVRHLTR